MIVEDRECDRPEKSKIGLEQVEFQISVDELKCPRFPVVRTVFCKTEGPAPVH